MNISSDSRQELYAQRIKLAAIEIPANADVLSRTAIKKSIDKSFIAGFRLVMLIAAGLALASSAAAWLLIRDTDTKAIGATLGS
jgi:hypothetical protein